MTASRRRHRRVSRSAPSTLPISPWIFCLLAGALLTLGAAPYSWWIAGWVAFTPAWLALRLDDRVRAHPFRYGYACGLACTLPTFWWIGPTSPLGYIGMATLLATYEAMWFLLVSRLVLNPNPGEGSEHPLPLAGRVFAAAALWVVLEWIKGWLIFQLNWNELGDSQVPCIHIRQLAALGSVQILSFVVMSVSLLIAEGIMARKRAWWIPAAGVAILLGSSWLYGYSHLRIHEDEVPSKFLTYMAVQPNVPELPYATKPLDQIRPEEEKSFRKLLDMSVPVVKDPPHVLIWPEAITIQRLDRDPAIRQAVATVMHYYKGNFLLGAEETTDDNKLYNNAYMLDPVAKKTQVYRKIYLVMLGEYLPFRDYCPKWLRNLWGNVMSFNAGTTPGCFQLATVPVRMAPLICFEETQAEATNNTIPYKPDLFVTLTNDGWYSGVSGDTMMPQQLQSAILRTIEHDRPLIRCANTGITCEISQNGEILHRIQDSKGHLTNVAGVLRSTLPLYKPHVTLYEAWGNWVLFLCKLAAVGLFGVEVWKRIKRRRAVPV